MNAKRHLEQEIKEKVREYYQLVHAPEKPFVPGKSRVNYAGRVYDEQEMQNLVQSALDFWLTSGDFTEQFEAGLAQFVGVKYCSAVNSGSSANLLAFMTLTVDELGDRKIKRGDEVITVAAGFPTTVAPIVQYGAVPVFVDVVIGTYNVDVSQMEAALSDKTKAVMLAHTLGNPFDIKAVKDFCNRYNLWLIEDNCDALGSRYEGKYTGTFGDLATSSFYPAHHITTGEGGAVYTDNPQLHRIMNSLRDWGRDCICPSGMDNTCGHRFRRQFGELPFGYDHKYVYSHFGYNLKMTEMQAAIGCAQLEKLPRFIEARKKNWLMLYNGLADLSDRLILPQSTTGSDPCWFGFAMTVRDEAGFSRNDMITHLEEQGIQTRMLFGGNLIKHPCFNELRRKKECYRIVSNLEKTDKIMDNTFWVGVYPGMTEKKIRFIVQTIIELVNSN